jgi:hypothetical protein
MRYAALLILTPFLAIRAAAQTGAKNGEWRTYGGDLGSVRHYYGRRVWMRA